MGLKTKRKKMFWWFWRQWFRSFSCPLPPNSVSLLNSLTTHFSPIHLSSSYPFLSPYPPFMIPMHVATFSLSTPYHIPIFVHASHARFPLTPIGKATSLHHLPTFHAWVYSFHTHLSFMRAHPPYLFPPHTRHWQPISSPCTQLHFLFFIAWRCGSGFETSTRGRWRC